MQSTAAIKQKGLTELVTFYVGNSLCGIDITDIQEINKQTASLTWVPKAPDYVVGVLNLRGMIVTILDLGKKLGLSPLTLGKNSRNIIVLKSTEFSGLRFSPGF